MLSNLLVKKEYKYIFRLRVSRGHTTNSSSPRRDFIFHPSIYRELQKATKMLQSHPRSRGDPKTQDTTSPGKKTGFCASRTTKRWVWFKTQEPKCTGGLLAIEGVSAPSLGAAHGGTDHPMLILCRRPQPNLALETTVLHQILQLNWRRPHLVICHHHVPVPHGSAAHVGPSSSFSLSWCFS